MQAKPLIAISSSLQKDLADPAAHTLNYIVHNYAQAIQAAGGLPVIIPLVDSKDVPAYIATIDKLVLSGGQNVTPSYYGQEQTIVSDDYQIERDIFELALIKEAIRQNKPIFGICRGLQLYNVAMGGTLHQFVDHHLQEQDGATTSHTLTFTKNNAFFDLYGSNAAINSFHRQAIDQLADSLTIVGQADHDYTIEAVLSKEPGRFIGVQWHPELLYGVQSGDTAIFDYFVNQF